MTRPPCEKWDLTGPLTRLTGGHRNTVWRCDSPAGSVVFKSTRRTASALAWLADVHAAARQAGFIVPAMRASRAGHLIEDGWTCEPFINGHPTPPEDCPDLAARIATFHQAASRLPQRPGFCSAVDLIDAPSGGDIDLTILPDAIRARCRAAWQRVKDRPQSVVHGDLTAGNLLVTKTDHVALIDWDECRRDLTLFDRARTSPPDAEAERACQWWEVACSWTPEPDYARALAARLT